MAYIRERRLLCTHIYEKGKIMKNTKEIGNTGEDIACTWLKKHGFLVVERNYLKKWGEIDIIAAKDKILHFIEVKSVIVKGIGQSSGHRPEENVHELKVRRLKRVIQTYLVEKHYGLNVPFKFHVILVYMDRSTRLARVEFLENIIL